MTIERFPPRGEKPELRVAPGAMPTERDDNEVHAQAFRDLEGDVCDLERMGQIAQDLIVQCVAREDGYRELELSSFAVMQLAKMLRDFKDRYYKRWNGELTGAS
jgi:hypothetical protein